jgi:hypothetical protein
MGVHVDRLDDLVRQCVHVDGPISSISIVYFTPTAAIEAGRRMVELGEELLREQSTRDVDRDLAAYGQWTRRG